MKRQDHLLVPRLEHGPAWALLVSLLLGAALFFVQQRMPAALTELERFRCCVSRKTVTHLALLDWVVAVHLTFTLSCSLLPKGTMPWRKGDAPRTLYCFRAPPPRFSFWLGGLAVVTYLAPFVFSLPTDLRGIPRNEQELSFLGALHGAGLMVLVSASVWCWLTWILGLRRVRLGEAPEADARSPLSHGSAVEPSFLGSGSALFIEQDGRVDYVRVFGLADKGAWEPRSFLVDDGNPEDGAAYRQAPAAEEPARDFDCYVPKQPGKADRLALPYRLDVWLWVCIPTAVYILKYLSLGRWAVAAATVMAAGCGGLLLRELGTKVPQPSTLKRWHWHQEGWVPPAVLMFGGFFMWTCLAWSFSEAWYPITPWYEAMTLVVPLWLPFWLSFVEPRIFVRLRNGRLEFRRLGLWLPITFAYAESPRVLVLCCGPWRLRLNLSRWGVQGWRAPDLAARMQPYLAYWEPKPEAAQGEEARAAEG